MQNETATNILSLLFFAKKLRIMHDFFQRCQEMAAELNGEMVCDIVSIVVLPVVHCSCIAGRINGFRVVLKYAVAVEMQTTSREQ